jgi:hypothetical protein
MPSSSDRKARKEAKLSSSLAQSLGRLARCCSSSVTAELAGMPVRPEGSLRSVMRMVQPVSE